MMDINYFLDDAQNSRQGQFELDFADVITCFDTFSTRLVTEDGRTLILYWDELGFCKDYEVIDTYETPLMECHPGMAEEIVTMLKHMNVDGETMQYILDKAGMKDQILRQLMFSAPRGYVEDLWDEIVEVEKSLD
jgi:hypothetical protein